MARKLATKSGSDNSNQVFHCISCKNVFKKQARNFPATQSLLYAGNNYYLPWCWRCVDSFFSRYRNECGLSEEETIKRLCSKFDIYWKKEIYNKMPAPTPTAQSRMRTYIGKTLLTQYANKTFDDTMAEEAAAIAEGNAVANSVEQEPDREVPKELIEFWGRDFEADDYFDLQASYDRLTAGKAVDDPATQMLVKQACLSEIEIAALKREGKPYEKQQASLINTLGSLNLKPSQIKDAEKNSGIDGMPLGVGIQHWEQTRPLPDIDPSWEDVDRIAQYMMTWYTGASMRMFDVDNEYTDMFNEAIDKYKVERPSMDVDADEKAVVSYIVTGGDKTNA